MDKNFSEQIQVENFIVLEENSLCCSDTNAAGSRNDYQRSEKSQLCVKTLSAD